MGEDVAQLLGSSFSETVDIVIPNDTSAALAHRVNTEVRLQDCHGALLGVV